MTDEAVTLLRKRQANKNAQLNTPSPTDWVFPQPSHTWCSPQPHHAKPGLEFVAMLECRTYAYMISGALASYMALTGRQPRHHRQDTGTQITIFNGNIFTANAKSLC